MTIDRILSEPWTYLAMLKGRQAEYEALRELAPVVRKQVTPLILLREAGGESTVKELSEALTRLRLDWGDQGPLLLDGEWLADPGILQLAIEAARAKQWITVPVARLSDPAPYLDVVRWACVASGAALRLHRPDFSAGDLDDRLARIMEALGIVAEQTDLILDLKGIDWVHLGADELAAETMLSMVPSPDRWRHLALAASSIPPDFRGFARNEVTRVPRAEAWLYESLFERRQRLPRLPVYADYVVANPDPVEEVHADYLPQTALLRYATPGDWLFARGFDINTEGSGHVPPLLRKLMAEPGFRAPAYSAGDRWIAEAAAGSVSAGNAMVWRRAASSHHMTMVTQQVATQFSP